MMTTSPENAILEFGDPRPCVTVAVHAFSVADIRAAASGRAGKRRSMNGERVGPEMHIRFGLDSFAFLSGHFQSAAGVTAELPRIRCRAVSTSTQDYRISRRRGKGWRQS
jgi:hypothetical protein